MLRPTAVSVTPQNDYILESSLITAKKKNLM